MKIVINADDFGLSNTINRAILASVQAGLCSSTTVMANQPGFAEACQLAHEHRLLDRVGIHLVLTAGCPLTEAIKRYPRFCDPEGRFCFSRGRPLFWLGAAERDVVAAELAAQIKRCRDAGLPITHIDSHHHCHTEFAILSVVINLARREGIRFCRLSRNCGPGIKLPRRMYKQVVNARIRLAHLAGTQFFGSTHDVLVLARKHPSAFSTEVMIHPTFDENNVLCDAPERVDLEGLVSQIPAWREAISYGFLRQTC